MDLAVGDGGQLGAADVAQARHRRQRREREGGVDDASGRGRHSRARRRCRRRRSTASARWPRRRVLQRVALDQPRARARALVPSISSRVTSQRSGAAGKSSVPVSVAACVSPSGSAQWRWTPRPSLRTGGSLKERVTFAPRKAVVRSRDQLGMDGGRADEVAGDAIGVLLADAEGDDVDRHHQRRRRVRRTRHARLPSPVRVPAQPT